MADNSITSRLKNAAIKEIILDENIFYAINSPDILNPSDADLLINTHLFSYEKSPILLNRPITFLTFQVMIQEQEKYSTDYFWIYPSLEICIISHESCLNVDNIPNIPTNRNDYIAHLLMNKFNGCTSLGSNVEGKVPSTIDLESVDTNHRNGTSSLILLDKLYLAESTEGVIAQEYFYRKLKFVTKDTNGSLCTI